MDAGLLYSGGKDSTLAGLCVERFFDLTAVHCGFGLTDSWEHARRAAVAVDFSFERIELDPAIAHEAADRIVEDSFPRNGIQHVHEHALERVAELSFDAIADGTRRDDRVPTVDRPLAQSIEDRHNVVHLAPLAGIGRDAIDAMASAALTVETGPSEEIAKGDYEAELRALIADEHGSEMVSQCFPEHVQSRVTGRRE